MNCRHQKQKKIEHFRSPLFRQYSECPDVFRCYHQQLFVHIGVSQCKMVLGEDMLWFNPNDEQIQESTYGARQQCVGEESVCASPPLLERIYSPRVQLLDQVSVLDPPREKIN